MKMHQIIVSIPFFSIIYFTKNIKLIFTNDSIRYWTNKYFILLKF